MSEMNDRIAQAVLAAAEHGTGQPKTFHVPEDVSVAFGLGDNPFDGMTLTSWGV